jgi:hypothetical protein
MDFDLVLVDAPCSGLGTYKEHPDVPLRQSPERIAAIAGLQRRILDNASRYVRPGGVLLYSTCTLTRAENEGQIEGFLARNSRFALEGIPGLNGRFDGGMTRFTPHRDGTEGFSRRGCAGRTRHENGLAGHDPRGDHQRADRDGGGGLSGRTGYTAGCAAASDSVR